MKHTMTSILAAFLLVVSMSSHSVIISGNIADSDYLTTDSTTGTFFVDYFNISVSADATLELSMQAFGDLHPYMLVVDNTGQPTPLLPAANWESPMDLYGGAATLFINGGGANSLLQFSFTALAGVLYQVGLTSQTYFELDPINSVGNYEFSVTGALGAAAPNDLILTQVPSPAPIGLTMLSLIIIWALRRQKTLKV